MQKSQSASAFPSIVTQKIILPVCKSLFSGIFIKIMDRSLRWEEIRQVLWIQIQPLAFLLKILKFNTRYLGSLLAQAVVLPTLFRRVHSLEPHLFSFSLFCPFQCGLVNVSKSSELWRLKERFIVTVCSRGFDFPDKTYGKYHGSFIRIMTEMIPTISRQNLRKWRYFICYDGIELWLYR